MYEKYKVIKETDAYVIYEFPGYNGKPDKTKMTKYD